MKFSSVEAPVKPAPSIPGYPQFHTIPVPAGSGAVRAFRGLIRPFSDDMTAKHVLRGIVAKRSLTVDEGRLHCDAADLPPHGMEEYLLDMAEPCTVVMLEFAEPRHPSAYLLEPAQTWRMSANPHTWWGREHLLVDGKRLPELCVYSGNLIQFEVGCSQLNQFLNQVATYLAKHLIYLRTRVLQRSQRDGRYSVVRIRNPEQPVREFDLKFGKRLVWRGFWPGEVAPSGARQHLQTVAPNGPCWCNSGLPYKECHLKREQDEFLHKQRRYR